MKMKKYLRCMLTMALASVVALMATAAAPSTYYNNAKNKSDKALMMALHQIIKGHTKRSYQNLWTDFKTTDCVGSTIIDRYSTSQYTWSSDQCGNYNGVGDCYNREHSIPNSWWGGSDTDTAYTDLHHMFPVDGWVNNERGNHPFGNCANGTPKGTGKLGSCTFSGYSGTVFEVADEYKGDFARVYFYFATRYMPRISDFTSGTGSVVFSASSYKGLTTWAINQLLAWHRNDPVSTLEMTRNDAVYGIQHNRNPFVDNPELVEYIWGNMQGQAWGSGGTATPALLAPVNGSTVNVGTHSGSGVSKTITVSGSNLTQALTVTVSGTGFAVTPSSITATAANNGTTVTVTYTGTATNATGTLTISSSEVSATVNLTASYSSGGGGGGTETIETWEGCTGYGNYANKSVQGKAFSWYFSNAGIFAQSNDHWNGTQGCRFGSNATSYIEMTQDVTDGASKLTFYACKYGNDATPTMQLQYSTDGGASWSTIATLSPNSTWQQYSYDLNLTGNVRFKFVQTAGARLNIDDIAITSNNVPVTNPELTAPVNGSTVNVGTIAATGTSVSKTIAVKGNDLTKALTLATTGTGFSVTPTTITAAAANAGTNVTVTYASSTAGNATGTLTISSSEVSVTVNLTANKVAAPAITISSLDAMEAEQDGESTIVSGTVIGENNSYAITLSVTGNFEISLNRYTWASSLTLNPSGQTFYVRLADTATPGNYTATITATTGVVSAYADVNGTVTAKTVKPGDVNMNGFVTMDDLTLLINYLLTGYAEPFDVVAADISGNSEVDMDDLTLLINILLTSSSKINMKWSAVPVDGGIKIDNPLSESLEVYDFDAEQVAVTDGDAMLDLPAGIYLVSGTTTSVEVIVE